MRRVVIEVYRPDSLEIYIHTDMKFAPLMGEGSYHNIICLREDGIYEERLSPLGRSILERIENTEGVGTVMYGRYGFMITCGKAFDRVDILVEVLNVIREEIGGDDLDISTQLRESGEYTNIGVFDGSNIRLALPQHTN